MVANLGDDSRRLIAAGAAELRQPCGNCFACSGRMVGADIECPGEVVIDDTRLFSALLQALATVERQEAAIARVKAKAEEWAALAPDDDWGDDIPSTVQADLGRVILATLEGRDS